MPIFKTAPHGVKVWLFNFVLLTRPQEVFRDKESDDLLYMIRLQNRRRHEQIWAEHWLRKGCNLTLYIPVCRFCEGCPHWTTRALRAVGILFTKCLCCELWLEDQQVPVETGISLNLLLRKCYTSRRVRTMLILKPRQCESKFTPW